MLQRKKKGYFQSKCKRRRRRRKRAVQHEWNRSSLTNKVGWFIEKGLRGVIETLGEPRGQEWGRPSGGLLVAVKLHFRIVRWICLQGCLDGISCLLRIHKSWNTTQIMVSNRRYFKWSSSTYRMESLTEV